MVQSPAIRAASGAAGVAARGLRPLAAVLLGLLLVEFLAGMVVNLWILVPAAHPGANPANYVTGSAASVAWVIGTGPLALRLHALLGLLLLILAVWMLTRALRAGRPPWTAVSVLGLIGVLAAGFNGASFLDYGRQSSSFLMLIAFLLASGAYAVGLYQTR